MKLFSYRTCDELRVALALGDAVMDVNRAYAAMSFRAGSPRPDALADALCPPDMVELIEGGEESLAAVKKAAAFVKRMRAKCEEELFREGILLPAENVAAGLAAPVPRPGKILCLGLNYRDHAEESGIPIPPEPVVFSKAATSVIGPGEPIELTRQTVKVDYEAELAVVIGKEAKRVRAQRAMDYVAGYTCLNDVSERHYQLEKAGGQWLLGKSFDTFCPLGPALVTKDEIKNPHALAVSFRLNGRLMQRSNTRHLIFDIPAIIQYLSHVCTLEPGDVISTGTPGGVGFARKPPVFLKPGDECRVEIAKVGVLENPVVDAG